MSITALIIEAIDLENLVAEIYQQTAELAPSENIAKELVSLSGEERDHANLLRAGRNYQARAPEAFGQARISKEELLEGIKAAQDLLARIENKKLLLPQILGELLELEGRFEKIHLHTLVEIHDESLKKLFQRLAGEDRDHLNRLTRLLELIK
ncbi:MAG: hypothetical protein QHH43_03155 [Candidatus Saccharicenans sp.]|jgi:rubrerythrin|nr:hypothetical protein [Candidatus Saccharicenans sp.]MDH7574744.1 hypothetical protein [Candidatus Saccharicenans sp.]